MNRVVLMMAVAVAVAGSGLFCTPPAQAAVVASAGLGPVEYQLIDLDPDDGIAPWLAVDMAAGRTFSLFSEATQSQPVASTSQSLDGAASWPARGVVASVAWAQASASIAGSSEGLGAPLSLVGSTADFISSRNEDRASFSAKAEDSGALFTLSPHTRVEFRLLGSVTARTTGGAGAVDVAYAGDFSFAAIGIRIDEAEGGPLVVDSVSFPCSPFVDQFPCANLNFQGHLQVVYDNTGSANFSGRLVPVVELSGSSHANALPVPEPVPLALWALGAGTLAWWTRRRNRSA